MFSLLALLATLLLIISGSEINGRHLKSTSEAGSSTTSTVDANIKLKNALLLHKSNDLTSAAKAYEEVVQFYSGATKSTILTNLAKIHTEMGDLDKAFNRFNEAIDNDPETSVRYLNMGIFLFESAVDYQRSMEYIEKAILHDNSNQQAMQMMGLLYQSIGNGERAAEFFGYADAIAQIRSNSKENINSLAECSDINSPAGLTCRSPFSLKRFVSILTHRSDDEFKTHYERPKMIEVSDSPPIYYLQDFLLSEELEHLLYLGESPSAKFESSDVMGDSTSSKDIPYRYSDTKWLKRDQIIRNIQTRLADYLGISREYLWHNSEQLQMVKYGLNGQYLVHPDSLSFHKRLFTALIYLKVPSEGGSTWFPFAKTDDSDEVRKLLRDVLQSRAPLELPSRLSSGSSQMDDAIKLAMEAYHSSADTQSLPGILVKPHAGSVVIFFNHLDSGEINPLSVHAGLPVTSGEKVIVNNWVKFDEKGLELFNH